MERKTNFIPKYNSRLIGRLVIVGTALAASTLASVEANAGLDCTNAPGPNCGLPAPRPVPTPPPPTCTIPRFPGFPAAAENPKDEPPNSGDLKAHQDALVASLSAEWSKDAAARAQTRLTKYPCYIAFVHGSGTDDSAFRGPQYSTGWSQEARPGKFSPQYMCGDSDSQEGYWLPSNESLNDSFSFRAGRQHMSDAQKCMVWRVAYDGKNLTFAESAMQVATELTNFIGRYNIPAKKLVIVTHSMGGLVGRFMLNNAEPTAPYYWPFFATVASRTKSMITVQAPHAGAQVADQLWGESDHSVSEIFGTVAQSKFLLRSNAQSKTRARESMRRVYVERAAGGGGWMADHLRSTKLYLIAGYSSEPELSGENSEDDQHLSMVAQGLCYKNGPYNNDGALCSNFGLVASGACAGAALVGAITGGVTLNPLLFFGSLAAGGACWLAVGSIYEVNIVPSDGFVETLSALGTWQRSNASFNVIKGVSPMQGNTVPWAVVGHNHTQARFDKISRGIQILNASQGQPTLVDSYLGSFLGDVAFDLPE
jgi:hypothetical protein